MVRRGLTCALAALLALAACGGPPKPSATEAEIAALERVTIDDPATHAKLSYLRAGDRRGRRVIFVHGTPGEAKGWVDYLTRVPPGFEYLAVDRPGFGESGPSHAVTSLPEQAAALAPLLEERAGRQPILVGHSLGGPVVLQAAADMPARIGAVVVLAGSLDPAQEHTHWAQPVGAAGAVRWMLPRPIDNANHELMALKPQLTALAPRLAAIRCPVEIVHGTKDPLVPYANVAFMRTHLSAASLRVRTLGGVNHFLPWNSVGEVRAAIARAAAEARGTC